MIGCDCPVCSSADPRDKRMRASVYVETPEVSWVIDTGPDFRAQCLRQGVRKVDAVLYTHAHTDHVMGMDDLRPFCPGGRPLPIYASAETMADLRRIFAFAFTGEHPVPGYVNPEPHVISGEFSLGETRIVPLPVPHGRTTVFGYLLIRDGVRLAAYLSDCKEVPPPAIEQIRGVRHLIVDALRRKPHPTHMNIEEALEVAEKVQPGQTWFTHLCHDLMHAELEPMLPDRVRIAYDGLRIDT